MSAETHKEINSSKVCVFGVSKYFPFFISKGIEWSIWKYKARQILSKLKKLGVKKSRLEFFFFKARKLGILIV